MSYGDGSANSSFGSSTNCVNLGVDLTAAPISGPLTENIVTQYIFSREGAFNVTITDYSTVHTGVKSLRVVVSSYNCKLPEISLGIPSGTTFLKAEAFPRDEDIYLRTSTMLQCDDVANTRSWKVEMVDPNTGEITLNVDLGSIPSRVKADLLLPASFLDVGTYRVTHRVVMTANKLFWNEMATHLKIIREKLVAQFMAGDVAHVKRGWNTTIKLEPNKYSGNPNPAGNQIQVHTCSQ